MQINAHRASVVLGGLLLLTAGELRGAAQGLPSVRVVAEQATVFERPEVLSGAVAVVRAGAVLELIDKRDGWYWILLGRDRNGSRQPGWIQTSRVELATPPTSRDSLRTLHEELGALPTSAEASRKRRKEERDHVRKAAEEALAAERIEEAARRVEEARRRYESLVQKGGETR